MESANSIKDPDRFSILLHFECGCKKQGLSTSEVDSVISVETHEVINK